MTTATEISVEALAHAGRVLFGPAFAPHGSAWRAALREVYRRRALETHPDRARALGRPEAELAREFRAVADAYRVLSAVVRVPATRQGRPRGAADRPPGPAVRPAHPRPESRASPSASPSAASVSSRARSRPVEPSARPAPPEAAPAAPRSAYAAREPLPRRRLRLAELLYYTGRVPWSAFVEAVAWQRAQRPALGRIAVELGYLDPATVGAVLARRRAEGATGERFGEYALRRGYLTRLQLLTAVGRQGRMQRRIGEYFLERGWLDVRAIEAACAELASHNARFP